MRIPNQRPIAVHRRLLRLFPGYDHRRVGRDGACFDMENLTTDDYPVLSTRKPRARNLSVVDGTNVEAACAMLGKEHLFVVNLDGTVCANGHTLDIGLKTRRHHSVSMQVPEGLTVELRQGAFLLAVSFAEGLHTFGYDELGGRWLYRQRVVDLADFGIFPITGPPDDRAEIRITVTGRNEVESLPKQLVNMGAVVCIFPDKCWVNAVKLAAGEELVEGKDYGAMEKSYDTDDYLVHGVGISVDIRPCKADGERFTNLYDADTAPAAPQDGAYWRDTSNPDYLVRQYNAATNIWNPIAFYTAIRAQYIGKGFSPGDSVRICGYVLEEPSDKLKTPRQECRVICCERDMLVVDGLQIAKQHHTVTDLTRLTVRQGVPDMDYVVCCGNRLWGCFCGEKDGQYINEIYASALGDFRNWTDVEGISTDAYTASVGSDGGFTGAAVLGGCPLFFKETCIEKVYPSAKGAHRVVRVDCDGIGKNCARSAVVIDEVLYYKSPNGVCSYTGSLPTKLDAVFGNQAFFRAVGGRQEKKYYLSMQDYKGFWHLFCYDTEKHLWSREDDTRMVCCTQFDGALYYKDEAGSTHAIGKNAEEVFSWRAESGLIGLTTPDNKYISRLDLRMEVEKDTLCCVWVSYDDKPGEEAWQLKRVVEYADRASLKTLTVPILPRRCDHMRLRLVGHGAWKLYSVSYCIENGSDENV